MRFPFTERASLGCHAEFCPSAATALRAFSGSAEAFRIPEFAGLADENAIF